jgi:hypothetical protein
MTLVANIGNYILTIIAALVLLVYVAGGAMWIISHGDPSWVTKGKTYIKNATVGLFIVLVAYTGVVALKNALVGQVSEGYIICDGSADTEGQDCDVNSQCSGFSCISKCEESGGFCTDEISAGLFEDNGDGLCASGTSCPLEEQSSCLPCASGTSCLLEE